MKYKIGFIGGGNMGVAIIDMLNTCAANDYNYEIYVADKDEEKLELLKKRHNNIIKCESNAELAKKCDYIVLAIKPAYAIDVLKEIDKELSTDKVLISIMAGVKIAVLSKYVNCKIVRTMPNLAATIGCSVTGISHKDLPENELAVIEDIFGKLGTYQIVNEELLDAVTAVSGSGPAYVYKFIDGMIKAGVKCGLSYSVAKELTVNTVIGAGKMCEFSEKTLPEMIDAVCSKGGTTIEAINVFEQMELEKIIDEAVKAAYNKSKILSDGHK